MHATHRLGTVFTVLAVAIVSTLTLVAADPASAAPVSYKIDPDHTYPSFEADHLGGLSVWRGKMNRSAGTVTLDRSAGEGKVDISVELGSIDFGQKALERWAAGPEFFDARNSTSRSRRRMSSATASTCGHSSMFARSKRLPSTSSRQWGDISSTAGTGSSEPMNRVSSLPDGAQT